MAFGVQALMYLCMKRGKIGPTKLLPMNSKSHTRFRLVPKSTALFQNMCAVML